MDGDDQMELCKVKRHKWPSTRWVKRARLCLVLPVGSECDCGIDFVNVTNVLMMSSGQSAVLRFCQTDMYILLLYETGMRSMLHVHHHRIIIMICSIAIHSNGHSCTGEMNVKLRSVARAILKLKILYRSK